MWGNYKYLKYFSVLTTLQHHFLAILYSQAFTLYSDVESKGCLYVSVHINEENEGEGV